MRKARLTGTVVPNASPVYLFSENVTAGVKNYSNNVLRRLRDPEGGSEVSSLEVSSGGQAVEAAAALLQSTELGGWAPSSHSTSPTEPRSSGASPAPLSEQLRQGSACGLQAHLVRAKGAQIGGRVGKLAGHV